MPRFSHEYLASVTRKILEEVGTPPSIALRVTEALINANLAGHDSHGVMRIPSYLEEIDKGVVLVAEQPEVIHETAAIAVMDGRQGWGHYVVDRAMNLAIEKARSTGIGAVSISRCNHAGRMGEYVETAAQNGCIGMVFLGFGGRKMGMATAFRGTEKVLATNPIAVGVPVADSYPFVLDFATTVAAQGKIKVARSRGESIPSGWILDAKGQPSTNPEDFFAGGSLLHFGEHKGYALSLMTCLLGGLSGAFQASTSRLGGVYVQAIDISAFFSLDTYEQNVRNFLAAVRSAKPMQEDREILVPGELEHRNREIYTKKGIELPLTVWTEITQAADKRGIVIPKGDESYE